MTSWKTDEVTQNPVFGDLGYAAGLPIDVITFRVADRTDNDSIVNWLHNFSFPDFYPG
jgi:hypothetical protein